jgi:hypothetical protein
LGCNYVFSIGQSIGEEEPRTREDQNERESEEEQWSSVLFTLEQLEVLLKMNRPDFGELVAALKSVVELAQSYLKGYAATWWRTVRQEEGKSHGYTW